MRQYIVKITDEALADMERLYHYIACDLQSPEYALAQYNRIAEKIMKLDVYKRQQQIRASYPRGNGNEGEISAPAGNLQ